MSKKKNNSLKNRIPYFLYSAPPVISASHFQREIVKNISYHCWKGGANYRGIMQRPFADSNSAWGAKYREYGKHNPQKIPLAIFRAIWAAEPSTAWELIDNLGQMIWDEYYEHCL